MSTAEESVILCEGFHDRAFWKGCLKHLGCQDLPGRPPFYDPFSKKVPPGHFVFLSPSGAFIRLQSCGGDKAVLGRLEDRLVERTTNTLRRLVVNLDTDARDAAGLALRTAGLRASVESRVAGADPSWSTDANADLAIDGGATLVSTVFWHAADPPDHRAACEADARATGLRRALRRLPGPRSHHCWLARIPCTRAGREPQGARVVPHGGLVRGRRLR